jgi:hypothetical protein
MKRLLLPALCTAFLSTSAHALIVTDTDGQSDIWEDLHAFHIGPNPPADQAPSFDLDGDGFSNLKESIAGTDPRDSTEFPAHGFGFIPPVYEAGEEGSPSILIDPPLATLTWPTIPGKSYQATPSEDLANWSTATGAYLGSGIPQTFEAESIYPDGSVPPKLFWRIEINDTDSDIDGLTDYEELHIPDPNDPSKTLDPFNPDSDGDGLTDGTEYIPGSNGLAAFTNFLTSDPDGSGLPASLDTDLIGRWDLESQSIAGTAAHYSTNARYADTTPFARPLVPYSMVENAEGMPSRAVATESGGLGGFLCPPKTLLENEIRYTVSMWAAINPGTVQPAHVPGQAPIRTALFSHHERRELVVGATTYYGRYTMKADGMWISRNPATGAQTIQAGSYNYRNYNQTTYALLPTAQIVDAFDGIEVTYPAGHFDDGKYHHYAFVLDDAKVSLYIDGALAGYDPGINRSQIQTSVQTHAGISFGRFYGKPAETGEPLFEITALKGRIDRLRAWSRTLTAAEALALYRQDADGDGLWDITEERTRKWDDHNGNAIAEPGEFAFVANPLYHDPANTDHDADGLTSLDEQNRTLTKIDAKDTDLDGLPDGFEDQYPPLDPLVWNDGSLDPDNDGLTTAQEYAGGVTNPNVADAALYPPTWLSIERSLRYDYDDYGPSQPNAPKKLTTTATWPGAVPTTDDPLTAQIPYNQLHASLTQKQPFPATFPTKNISPDLKAEGNAGTIPNPPCHHASLSHKRIIIKVGAATAEARIYNAILLTERTIDGEDQPPTSQGLTLTIPAGQTQSATYDLAPQFTGDGIGTAAYSETVRQSVFPVEFQTLSDVGWRTVDELKIAKWENAWKNESGIFRNDFINSGVDREVDAFRVLVRGELPEAARRFYLSTTGSATGAYDDNPTEIVFEKDPGWLGFPSLGMLSRKMILVADDRDNTFRNDNKKKDQTHIAALGSTVELRHMDPDSPTVASAPVKAKKHVNISLRILWQGANGPTQQTLDQAAKDLKVAKEIYAQAGITLNFTVTVHNTARMGIDLSDGLTIDLPGSNGTLEQEARTILEWQATPNQADVICLYMDMNQQSILSDGEGVGGIAIADHEERTHTTPFYWDTDVSDRFMGTFFMSSRRLNAGVLAHELGHILRLLHPGDELPLYQGELELAVRNVMISPMKYDDNPYFSSKRFRQYQEENMHGSRFVDDPE